MPIYLLIPIAQNADRLEAGVIAHVPAADRYRIANNAGWFVKFRGTTVELSNLVGVTGQAEGASSPVGSAIVSLVSSYYGRGSTDMWEWLRTRMEAG